MPADEWSIAALTRLTSLEVSGGWSAAAVPLSVREVTVRWARLPQMQQLLTALRPHACTIIFTSTPFAIGPVDLLTALSEPWMASRVRLMQLACREDDLRMFAPLAATVLSRMRDLRLTGPATLPVASVSLTCLTSLQLSNWRGESNLAVPSFAGLERLAVPGSTGVTSLAALAGMRGLRELSIAAAQVSSLDPPATGSLTFLELSQCPQLTSLGLCEGGGECQLRRLRLSELPRLQSAPDAAAFVQLRELTSDDTAADLGLAFAHSLTRLKMDGDLPPTPFLSRVRGLCDLELRNKASLLSLACFGSLSQLTALRLLQCSQLTSLRGLEMAASVETACIQCQRLVSLAGLSSVSDTRSPVRSPGWWRRVSRACARWSAWTSRA